jgi:hypothetical protein
MKTLFWPRLVVYIVSWRRKRMHSNTFSRKRPFTFYNHLVRALCLADIIQHTSLSYLTHSMRRQRTPRYGMKYLKPVFTPISVGWSDVMHYLVTGASRMLLAIFAIRCGVMQVDLCAGLCTLGEEFCIFQNCGFLSIYPRNHGSIFVI